MANFTFNVINSYGKTFKLEVVENGATYGENGHINDYGQSMVRFYDMDQFVSEYFLSTLLEDDGQYGLNLDDGVESWSINPEAMESVVEVLKLI